MDLKDICVEEKHSLKEAMKIIDHGGLRIAFVTDDEKRLAGVTTSGDIRKAILKGANLETRIKEIMNPSPIVINTDWSEKEIKTFLKKDDVRSRISDYGTIRIPVVDEKNKIVDILIATEDTAESYVKPSGKIKNKIEIDKPVKEVLIVGGAGYLGSVLCRKLLDRGYIVKVLDNLTYGDHGIKELYDHPRFKFFKGDIRDIEKVVEAAKESDAVIHLAGIVGDPASALDPLKTIEVNYLATKMLAEICKYSQINRFIFASTCSVYGASPTPDTKIDEKSPLNPVSLYAEMKLKSEQGILECVDENFSPTILRMATLYGLSKRMRFDLVVNILSIKALIDKKYYIFGGEQWRPNLHVDDAAEAYIKCLEAPIGTVRDKIFNVGSNEENYKIIEIGEKVKNLIPEAEMIIDENMVDERNYNVSFDKIAKELKYTTKLKIQDGIAEIIEQVEKGEFEDYTDHKYSNYKFLQKNSSTKEILLEET